jgi:hypothetical protein
MGEALLFVLIALALGAVGIVIGMLVAPRLSRWAERDEEEGPKE